VQEPLDTLRAGAVLVIPRAQGDIVGDEFRGREFTSALRLAVEIQTNLSGPGIGDRFDHVQCAERNGRVQQIASAAEASPLEVQFVQGR